jgi:hypothetical protein
MALYETSLASQPWSRPGDFAWVQGRLLHIVLFLTILSSPLVFIEPSPYEAMMAVLALATIIVGASVDRKIVPLILLLLVWNTGLLLALMPILYDSLAVTYSAISIYLAVNSIIFAMLVSTHCEQRMATIRTAYILAAVIAAGLGTAGYFGIGGEQFVIFGRAKATFKDPNVFGPFLILPLLFIIQSVVYRGIRLTQLIAGGIILSGLFLSFSRGAWGNFVFAALLMIGLMFVTSPSPRFRARITTLSLVAGMGVMGLLAMLLSIGSVTKMFEQRAELTQSYDVGSGGRFTTQLRALHQVLDFPNGLGPLQYAHRFGLDPHDDYLNAFYANGWIGGVAYPTLVLVTIFVGFRALLVRTPWQPYLIAAFSAYVGSVSEGFIVGTEHWRHYYLLLGLVWGLSAATENARRAALRMA